MRWIFWIVEDSILLKVLTIYMISRITVFLFNYDSIAMFSMNFQIAWSQNATSLKPFWE
jgi:hypothetical protein